MKRLLTVLMLLVVMEAGRAEDILMRYVFRQVPDSLMPYLSANDRLDFIDFMDSSMKAEVKNSLGGTSEMTVLTADSLSIRMSPALRVDMFLAKPLVPVADSCCVVVCFVQTFGTDSLSMESTVSYFTSQWRRLASAPELSAADKQRISSLNVQTILKRDDEILKKN